MLKTLANQYKATYQQWIEILSNITDDVCDAWDAHQKQKEAEKYFSSLSPEQKQVILASVQATAQDLDIHVIRCHSDMTPYFIMYYYINIVI